MGLAMVWFRMAETFFLSLEPWRDLEETTDELPGCFEMLFWAMIEPGVIRF